MSRGVRAWRRESLFGHFPVEVKGELRNGKKKGNGNGPNKLALLAGRGRAPDGQDVLVLPNTEDDAVDLADPRAALGVLLALESFADKGPDDLLPDAVGDAFAESEDPSPTAGVGGVLPGGCDGGAEDVEVRDEVRGRGGGRGGRAREEVVSGRDGRGQERRRREVREERVQRFNLRVSRKFSDG